MQSKRKPAFFYESFILLECLIWGVGNPIAKIGLETLSPFYCLAIRFTISFLFFVLFFGRKALREIKKEKVPLLLLVGSFSATSFIFSVVCLKYTTATAAGFFMAIPVIFTPALSWYFLKKKPSRVIIPAIAVVLLGMYFLCGNTGTFSFGLGEFLALMCSLCQAFALTFTAKYMKQTSPFTLCIFQTGTAAAISIVFALLVEDYHTLSQVAPAGWGAVLYLAFGCTCIAFILQNQALKHANPVLISLVFCSEPLFTAAASYFMLGETLTVTGYTGAVLILAGIIIASVRPQH